MFRSVLLVILLAAPLHAEVTRIEVKSRDDLLSGKSFAAAGLYEKLSGKIYFAVDPRNSANRMIADALSANAPRIPGFPSKSGTRAATSI